MLLPALFSFKKFPVLIQFSIFIKASKENMYMV
jgi:hypothetical protein